MNYEKLTRRLIESCVKATSVEPMEAVLPNYVCFDGALERLYREHGGPAYEEFLDEMAKGFSVMVEQELSKEDA